MRRSPASSGVRAVGALALVLLSACSLGTETSERPTSARVRIEGTSPHPLMLVTAIDFYEQYEPQSGSTVPILVKADTLEITLPYERTVDVTNTGSMYAELRNWLVPTASVRMRVELDNGKGYDQTATLSDNAALIYYYLYTDWSKG